MKRINTLGYRMSRRMLSGFLWSFWGLSASYSMANALQPVSEINLNEPPPPWEARSTDVPITLDAVNAPNSATTGVLPQGDIEAWYQKRQQHPLSMTQRIPALEAKAQQGDIQAQYELAVLLQSAKQGNIYQAIHWFTEAAKAGHAKAQYALALIHQEKADSVDDQQTALNWAIQAATKGHRDAQYYVGLQYLNGGAASINHEQARHWLQLASEQGHMPAKIALMVKSSKATESSADMAVLLANSEPEILERDAPLTLEGKPVAQTQALGEDAPSFVSPPVPSLEPQHSYLAPPMIALNNAEAQAANILLNEEPEEYIKVANVTAPERPATPPPSKQPIATQTQGAKVRNIMQSAKRGDKQAQLALGTLYEDGDGGLSQDYDKAIHWYQQSADQGYAKAQYNLGLLYEDGKGVKQDFYEAAQWYKRAANNGFAEAQNNLGVLYITGKGVMQDKNRAELMFRRAAEQGNKNAVRNLAMLSKG
ncbi:MAG: tetratricopeptide repeat protein [bacterium]